jgi:hypothetical protein
VLDGQENTLQVAAPPKTYTHVPRGQGTLDSFLQTCEGKRPASAPDMSGSEPLLDPDLVQRSTHVVSSDVAREPGTDMNFVRQNYPPQMEENLKRNFDRVEYDTYAMPSDNKRKRLF